jgi:hypothetical protein
MSKYNKHLMKTSDIIYSFPPEVSYLRVVGTEHLWHKSSMKFYIVILFDLFLVTLVSKRPPKFKRKPHTSSMSLDSSSFFQNP